MRTLFLGSGEIGIPSLQWLLDSPDCEVVGVWTQPDRPFGRKLEPKPPAIKVLARDRGIPVHQPEKLRAPAALAELQELEPDLMVVMAYGQILTPPVIHLPAIACINLHASLLPRHRGASPIQAAIRAGDDRTGVTVMYVDEGLDTGDILLSETCVIRPDDTGADLHDRLSLVAVRALARALPLLRDGMAPRTPQPDDGVTYLGKLTREDGKLDWFHDASALERWIRAYHPWPGTYTLAGDRKLKVFPPAEVMRAAAAAPAPGTVIEASASGIQVACESGALRLNEVQLEGRKRQSSAEFLRGHGQLIHPGTLLG